MDAAAAARFGNSGLPYDFVGELKGARSSLLRYAHQLTGNPAARDDLVQDTLLRAWSARERFAAGTNFKAWLFRIARNSFLSGLRRQRRQVDMPDEDMARLLTTPALQETAVHMQDFERAVAKLPPLQAEALLALNGSQEGYDAVADTLGIPSGTLRSRAHRARRTVMQLMDDPEQMKTALPPVRSDAAPVDASPGPRRNAYAVWKASGSQMIG